jgi:hypothetical protein
MPLDFQRARPLLQSCNLPKLFIEELGWEPCRHKLTLRAGDTDYAFTAVAEKRGFTAWLCESPTGGLPDHATRLKLDRKLSETSFEHLIVFVTGDRASQSWMWVRREPGKPLAARTHEYHRGQPGDSLLQKLQILYVSLEEEEAGLSTVVVAGRARAAFDLERVTKSFYRDFDTLRIAFLKFIDGIGEVADREWYASVMLNRLMFVYFIQRKGFLDGDPGYLRHRLDRCQKEQGKDKFYTFYRYFLLRLFHEGFGKRRKDRAPELERLLGNIPYLNGGLFDVHELEKPDRYGQVIQIPDQAFERVFTYFDQYQWHLDERPLRADNEINPDVLGYIFEKYINQKQMGAYYTKEDITEYISKNTVLPFLFDAARAKCKVAFESPSSIIPQTSSFPCVWDLLCENPDRYIYPAVRHGADKKLPPEIAAGLDTTQPNLIERRKAWNKPAPAEYALPTEIWREVVARRQRYWQVWSRLSGRSADPDWVAHPPTREPLAEPVHASRFTPHVSDINDFITLNLDLRQFAQDVIQNCEVLDLLMALWQAITTITVLDPTGGSGAFIFAALNILEPLYEACLDRMEAFLAEWDMSLAHRLGEGGRRPGEGKPLHPNYHKKFTEVLGRVDAHPNRRYFVLKSIILNNLYAVDIMAEAVEICKLRLFLKLAAQVEPDATKDNLGIEPLPDIDFNIRAGNTLVGYATADEVRKCMKELGGGQMKLMGEEELGSFARFNTRCADVEQAFSKFRQLQTEGDGTVPAADKLELQKRLKTLEDELNRHLAGEYGVKVSDKVAYDKWVKSHQPFHWFIQFYGILNGGGFDVIIGNPPYVVNTLEKVHYEIREGLFATYPSKNLYAFVFERSLQLGGKHAAIGMIVQLTALSAEKMSSLQDLLLPRGLLVASAFPRRPESIFDGVEMPVTIMLSRSGSPTLHTTRVNRFYTEERPSALATMGFAGHAIRLHGHRIAKIGSPINVGIYRKVESQKGVLGSLTSPASKHVLYYQEACRYWVKACVGLPFFRRNGERMAPPHGRTLNFRDAGSCAFAGCLVNSTLFYWFYSAFSDCEHINDSLIRDFRIPAESNPADWIALESRLAESQKCNARRKTILTKQGHKIEYDEMDAPKSKPILDEIDTVLAGHYGFTAEELDFILNYDIKYRLGRSPEEEEE